ncbi:hypothetical protein BDA96_06G007400 [Sorghum bicolor]|uniref:rRNA N-glycosylase n=2 Tax=Sorghum bicolor TaxID=4558 RepID=A0A921UAJ6_SORBI|nr:60 kDa jasmonate-induced protein [Sorghum bicolor]EES11746.1 hypothetical protein SORBI_3006G006800 [Sorghum bicolor]KAG0524892.1 hypothetical protein BDA96_06G007400 [Sorghum bicolor]|eukprot:XP_002447418.1 60 kDa jasmonate-induced protein [Sorghum bicolor]
MEHPSLSMAIFLLALSLLPSNNIDQAQASPAAGEKPNHGGTAPAELIPIKLVGRDGDRITLALQPHDLSLAGFANGSHHWFIFPGNEHLIRNGTTLPFGNTYRDLIGGLANLPSLPLGREPALRAISAISACDVDDELGALKRGLATLTVTKCEALRLAPVRDTVSGGWESGDARLTEQHLRYIEHWDTISFEIVRAHKTGEWNGPFTELLRKKADIHSKEEALAVVSVVANPTLAQVLMAHARSA